LISVVEITIWSVMHGKVEFANKEYLLATCPGDVNASGEYHGSPLHAAFAKRYVDVAVLMFEYGADINALDNERLSSLHRASRSGHRDAVQCLLERHADVNKLKGRPRCIWGLRKGNSRLHD
jgi:ankyrin repeat protein